MADYETSHVGYHGANNVSNFGGDPVTQFNFKKRFIYIYSVICVRPKTCRHIVRPVMNGSSTFGEYSINISVRLYLWKENPINAITSTPSAINLEKKRVLFCHYSMRLPYAT